MTILSEQIVRLEKRVRDLELDRLYPRMRVDLENGTAALLSTHPDDPRTCTPEETDKMIRLLEVRNTSRLVDQLTDRAETAEEALLEANSRIAVSVCQQSVELSDAERELKSLDNRVVLLTAVFEHKHQQKKKHPTDGRCKKCGLDKNDVIHNYNGDLDDLGNEKQ